MCKKSQAKKFQVTHSQCVGMNVSSQMSVTVLLNYDSV